MAGLVETAWEAASASPSAVRGARWPWARVYPWPWATLAASAWQSWVMRFLGGVSWLG